MAPVGVHGGAERLREHVVDSRRQDPEVSDVKTLLVTVPNGTVITSLLTTGCVAQWAREGLKVVLLTPEHVRAGLEKHYGGTNIVFERYTPWDYPPVAAVVSLMTRASLAKRRQSTTLRLLEHYNARITNKPWRMWLWALAPGSLALERAGVALLHRLAPRPYGDVFERHRPDAVFLNNPYMPAELPVVAEASRRNLPMLALCHSWDNLTSRGPMPFAPQKLYVWNRVNAQEAEEWIDGLQSSRGPVAGRPFGAREDAPRRDGHLPAPPLVPADKRIEVIGIPLFDVYADTKSLGTREAFLRAQGLDPAKKLISVMGVTERSCPIRSQMAYVEDLVTAIRDGRLSDCQVYFRMHPKMKTGETGAWGERLGIVCCFPRTDEVFDDGWVPGNDDLMLQARSVVYSDLCLNVASSMTIHCAITGTKVLSPAFDHEEGLPYEHSVRRVYDYEHNRKMHALGFVKVVGRRADFISAVRMSLDSPLDEAARQRVLADYAGQVDGHAAQRLAISVLRELAV
ncbi:MAG: hypothetical protein AB7F75_03270 [Planctomycetota bacterium]